MRRLIPAFLLFVILAPGAERVCYERDLPDTTVAKVCVTISPALRQALNDHIASQVTVLPDGTRQPRYRGRAHLVFETLSNMLFANVLQRFPAGSIAQARADRLAAETAEKTAQDSALPTVPATEP